MQNFVFGSIVTFIIICALIYVLGLMFLARFFMESAAVNPHVKDQQTYSFVSCISILLWLVWPISLFAGLLFLKKK